MTEMFECDGCNEKKPLLPSLRILGAYVCRDRGRTSRVKGGRFCEECMEPVLHMMD